MAVSNNRQPEAVAEWLINGRPYLTMGIESLEEFTNSWWWWWNLNQPDERGISDPPVRRPLRNTGKVEWDYLYSPGPKGTVQFLVSLAWWRHAINGLNDDEYDVALQEWMEASEDVAWTLRKVLEYCAKQMEKSKRSQQDVAQVGSSTSTTQSSTARIKTYSRKAASSRKRRGDDPEPGPSKRTKR